jgi:hypothetical protein
MPVTEALTGVSRQLLLQRALEEIPAALHAELEEIALEPQGRAVHHGMVMELVLWRARWRRNGWPPLSGPIAVHEGHIY